MRKHLKGRRWIESIAMASLWVIAVHDAAAAQEPKSTQIDRDRARPQKVEDIIVTGTRASLESGIERKKSAGTVVDSLVAEDVASFPDKNVGEALQRITGIQLTRDFGEGAQVSIRGVEPDLNRVEVNGATTLGQGGTGSRGADFRELASELIKSIDVYKGYTVDLTEGGVGGTVSIQTRRPLELKRPLLSITGSGQYLDTLDHWRPRGNITAATKLLNGRLGVMVNFTYDRAETRSDFIRNTAWNRYAGTSDQTDLNNDNAKIFPNSNFAAIATPAGCNAVSTSLPTGRNRAACLLQFAEMVPAIPRYSSWERRDKRISGVGTLQYAVTDNFDVYVEYQRNRRNMRLIDNNFAVDANSFGRLANGNNCAAASVAAADRCVIDEAGNLIDFSTAPTATSATAGAGSILNVQHRDFKQVLDSRYTTVGFNWQGDGVRINGMAVRSKGTTWTDSNTIQLNASVPSIRVHIDPTNGNPTFDFPASFDPGNLGSYLAPTPADLVAVQNRPIMLNFSYRPDEVDVTENQYKIDADFDINHPILNMIETGLQYRESTTLRYGGGINATGTEIPDAQGNIVPTPYVTANVRLGSANLPLGATVNGSQVGNVIWTRDRFQQFLGSATDQLPYDFFPTGNIPGIPTTWLRPNVNQAMSFFDQTYLNHDRMREVNGIAQIPTHDVREKIWAGYVKANYTFDAFGIPIDGNFGVRYTHTDDRTAGFVRVTQNGVVTRGDLIVINNSYDDWLPAFNLQAGLVPNRLVARFGVSKVLARPKPTDLSPNFTCADDPALPIDTCSGGNPNLKPYRATQYDLNLSWFVNRDTMLSVAGFYKDVSSFIVGPVTIAAQDVFGTGTLYDIRQPINGAGAKLKGVEVSAQTAFTFLPAPFDGFGIQANYTYSDASKVGLFDPLTGEALGFPGLSKHSYNLIGYYDKNWLNVRLAYNGRSSYLINPNDRNNAVVRDGTGYLDGKITFRFKNLHNATIFVEGKNLTAETERDTASGVPVRLLNYSYSGRRYYVGASVRF